jgi:hypothetical protein
MNELALEQTNKYLSECHSEFMSESLYINSEILKRVQDDILG